MPGGSAAGSALGYRLMTLSGVQGPDAGFALATAGLGSAVVLNVILWVVADRVDPHPRRERRLRVGGDRRHRDHGVSPRTLVFGLMEGQGRAERVLRWIARKLAPQRGSRRRRRAPGRRSAWRIWPPIVSCSVRVAGVGGGELVARRRLAVGVPARLRRRRSTSTRCIVAFGLANVLAVIPITPGGLGVVEGVYILRSSASVSPGPRRPLGRRHLPRSPSTVFPIVLGGVLYAHAARRAVEHQPP